MVTFVHCLYFVLAQIASGSQFNECPGGGGLRLSLNLHVCVCVQGSSTRKTLVCASSEDSRESERSLESAHPY